MNVMMRDLASWLRRVQVIKSAESLLTVGEILVICIDKEGKLKVKRGCADVSKGNMRENF